MATEDKVRTPKPKALPQNEPSAADGPLGKAKKQVLERVSDAVYWLGNNRFAYWIPVLTLAVAVFTLVRAPRLLAETPVLGLAMPSEDAIPAAKPAPGVKIDPQDIVWRFRYEQTGTEFRAGIPYWIFRVLPSIFDDEFRGRGWDRFGFGDDDATYYASRPVGRGLVLTETQLNLPLHRIRASIKRVAINCSGCHRGEYIDKNGRTVYVDGMPNHTADLQGFKRFFPRAFHDPRFHGGRVIEEINRALHEDGKAPLTAREETIYELLVVALKQVSDGSEIGWMNRRADNGPGRIDPFNAVKFEIIGVPDDGSAGQIDFPSIWNQAPEIRRWHHNDGNTRSSQARNRGSSLGVGGIALSLNKPGIDAVGAWLDRDLPVPAYPFTPPDAAEVERGLQVFTAECAVCHGLYDRGTRKVREVPGSKYMERVRPGTDPGRSRAFLAPAAAALNDFGERRHLWEKDAFRAGEEGEYLCGPLDGIWARAPYLHNGAVPTLADLLKPAPPDGALDPAEAPKYRPRAFYRGDRRFDEERVGWVSTEATEGARVLFEYRTADESGQPIPGNSNAGHPYGVELPDEDKRALLAYLKTL